MEEPSFTIYLRGGPFHGLRYTRELGCGFVAKVGERHTVGAGTEFGRFSAIYEYEFTYVEGPIIVARFVKTVELSNDMGQPSWGPWRTK